MPDSVYWCKVTGQLWKFVSQIENIFSRATIFLIIQLILQKNRKEKTMKMEKDHLNDKVLDKEKALSVIKTSYLNSYKVIVAGARDFADYAFIKKKT